MRILSLDTSTVRGSVALLDGPVVRAELRLASMETHAARLLRSIEFLMGSAGWDLSDLELIAAGIGPGSFTGIRIGLSTALGLAQTLKIPFAGVSGLDALAYSHINMEKRIGIVLDAQRRQVYYAEYTSQKGGIKSVGAPGLWFPEQLKVRLAGRHIRLIGDGAQKYASELGLASRVREVVDPAPFLAGPVGRLAFVRRRSWRLKEFYTCEPLYIRPPDARKPNVRKH